MAEAVAVEAAAAFGIYCCLARFLTPRDAVVAGGVPAVAGVAAALVAVVAGLEVGLVAEVQVVAERAVVGRADNGSQIRPDTDPDKLLCDCL